MQVGKSACNFGGSAFRRPFGNDSAGGLSKLVALLPNSMKIVHNWSEKGVYMFDCVRGCKTYYFTVVFPLIGHWQKYWPLAAHWQE